MTTIRSRVLCILPILAVVAMANAAFAASATSGSLEGGDDGSLVLSIGASSFTLSTPTDQHGYLLNLSQGNVADLPTMIVIIDRDGRHVGHLVPKTDGVFLRFSTRTGQLSKGLLQRLSTRSTLSGSLSIIGERRILTLHWANR